MHAQEELQAMFFPEVIHLMWHMCSPGLARSPTDSFVENERVFPCGRCTPTALSLARNTLARRTSRRLRVSESELATMPRF